MNNQNMPSQRLVIVIPARFGSTRLPGKPLADILGKPLPVAPERLAVRAQALVGFAAERQLGHGGGFFGRLFSSGTRYALQRAAMAAVAMVIAGAGFIVGGGLGESFAQQRYGSNVTQASSSETSSELTDFSDGI